MRIKTTILLISLLSWSVVAFAQTPPQLIFSRITKKEGLASNSVFQTVRDKQGFLWIATLNGLQRFDRNRFLTFRHIPGDTNSIAENSIGHLFMDSKNRLWLLSDKKIGIFNTSSFLFSETKIISPIGNIKKIMEDDAGKIVLFADYNKQFVYDESKKIFDDPYLAGKLPPGYSAGDMVKDPANKNYWITGKEGTFMYNGVTKQFNYKEKNKDDEILNNLGSVKNGRYPFIAKDSTFWMVSWVPFRAAPVLYSYNKTKNELLQFEKIREYTANSYYEIWSIWQQSNGTIWIYGMGLLAYYKQDEKRFINIQSDPYSEHGIDYDYVSNLYEDRENNVWVCTNKGLYRFNINAQVFSNISNRRLMDTAIVTNAVSAIVETKNHGIWISTWGAGVFSYSNEWQPISNPVTNAGKPNKTLHVSYMMQRRNEEIWLGLQSGEIKIYDPAAGETSSLSLALLKNEIIQQLLEDHHGNIWIGTNSGLLVKCENGDWKDSSNSFKTVLSEIGDIVKLYGDKNEYLWICTATNGVFKIDSRTGKIIQQFTETKDKTAGLLSSGATDIVQYNDSIFLIASNALCILNSNTNTFSYLTSADGLPAENIINLILDKKKRLWLALNGGLSRFNLDSKVDISYGASDGITNDIFEVSTAAVLRDGRIAIGTPHDFLVFDPERTTDIDTSKAPVVAICGFILGDKQLSVDSLQKLNKITLPYDNTNITVQLSTLTFRDRYNIVYMLEGLDKTWKETYKNEINFQYLPPGNYTLKLKSKSSSKKEVENITSLNLLVTPPFWRTWWFYLLVVLLAGGLLFWFDRERMKRKEFLHKMRSSIADDLHQEVNTALGNINILSEMAKLKADTEPKKSIEFIEQIHSKSQNMIIAMDDMLWSIDPNNDRMENFIMRYKEYIDALRNRNGVVIDLQIDRKVEALKLNMKFRKDIFWLFKGGITNVVKTGGSNCRIYITYAKPNLTYTLQFDTAGMDILQINTLRQRKELADKLKEMNANLDVQMHKTSAVFALTIPV